MGTLILNYVKVKDPEGIICTSLPQVEYKQFNASILGIRDISKEGEYTEALAAIFDLEGFTEFCNQIDPHLVVPDYLERFFTWLFKVIADEFKKEETGDSVILWNALPFFAKFLGDGMLFLWDTRHCADMQEIGNIVVNLNIICDKYRNDFLPTISKSVAKPPQKLRCGIARGQIISIGDRDDYVGSCINLASRPQKFSNLTFAFPRRGFDLNKCFTKRFAEDFITKKVDIRGIGHGELIMILKKEYKKLSSEEKALFKDP